MIKGEARSVAGTICYVKNMEASSASYRELGFELTRDEVEHLGVGSYWMDLFEE